MKKSFLLLSFVIICAIGIVSTGKVNSKIVFPAPGYCGDPSGIPAYVTCASSGCHGGSPQAVNSSNLTLLIGTDTNSLVTLDSTFKYVPNTPYYISFQVLAPGYVWGFEMTALDLSNNMAGAFTVLNTTTTHLSPAGRTRYISHLHANPNTSKWVFQWTAPAADSGNVTFYYAFNSGIAADFNAALPDSNIFAANTVIKPSSAGIENISNNISALQVYPNPINGVFSVSFNVLNAGNADAQLYSVDGRLCSHVFNQRLGAGVFNGNYDVSNLAPGIYLLKLNVGGATVTQKIVKE